jgi:glycosyltransferase involved in cell wall biosynthesis
VIGCVGRLEYGKNYEFALEAIRSLVEKKRKVMLVLKGDFPLDSPYPDYQRLFSQMLNCYAGEPWFLWDRSHTPYPEVLHEYASFDLLLHPSGAEGGSQVVVECLGLKKPVVVLRCSTNPYLFSGVAHFVQTTGILREAQLPFYIPDLEDLCSVLDQELSPPDYARVEERFHESQLLDRLPLLFQRDTTRLRKLYEQDRKTYMLW